MKKLLFILLTAAAAAFIWVRQYSHWRSTIRANATLTATLQALDDRARQADAFRDEALRRMEDLRTQIAANDAARAQASSATNPSAYLPAAEPDPAHSGGWPAGTAYFYLPKQYLTNAQYKLLDGARLTDEAATLLGMSPAERSGVDQALGDLVNGFRQLEMKNMKRIEMPQGWQGATFGAKLDSAVVYQIAGLGGELDNGREQFSSQLQQILGASRAQLLAQGTESFLRQNLDDLGIGDRTVGFLTATENDGSKTVWYGIADARHGEGSFQRVPDEVAPDSQIAYYAGLFGITLPGKP